MLKSVENRAIMRNNNQSLDVPFTKAESKTEEATMTLFIQQALEAADRPENEQGGPAQGRRNCPQHHDKTEPR